MADTVIAPKTIVGLFETKDDAARAADELFREGFSQDQIGIVAGHELSNADAHTIVPEDSEGKVVDAIGKGLGFGGILGAIAGGAVSLLFPGAIVLGGALASAFLGAGLGASAGGVMAGLMAAGVDESDARLFEEALRHGGVVLTVHTDEAHSRQAVQVLDRNGALDMDEHRLRWGDRGEDCPAGATDNRRDDTHRAHSWNRPGSSHWGENLEAVAQQENANRLEPWAKQAAILGAQLDPNSFDDEFHRDYQNRYAGTGVGYDRYQPAYAMGARYARDSVFYGRDWSDIEPHARREWEAGNAGRWDHFSGAVRHAWERIRGHR